VRRAIGGRVVGPGAANAQSSKKITNPKSQVKNWHMKESLMPLDMRSASAWTWQRWRRERRWRARGRWRGEGERLEAPGAVSRAHNHLHQEDEDEYLGVPIDGGTQGSVEEAAEAGPRVALLL